LRIAAMLRGSDRANQTGALVQAQDGNDRCQFMPIHLHSFH